MGSANDMDTCYAFNPRLVVLSAATSLRDSKASGRFHVLPDLISLRTNCSTLTRVIRSNALLLSMPLARISEITKKQLLSIESSSFLLRTEELTRRKKR